MAQFIYPPNGNFSTVATLNQVNVFDRLEVTYSSTWSSLNLTLFCLLGTTSTVFEYWNVQGNPIINSGTYVIPSIASIKFDINQFPTKCNFKLTKYGNNDIGLNGELFQVVSVTGTSTTYKITTTASSSTGTSSTSTSQSVTTTTSTSSAISTKVPGTSSNVAVASSTSTGGSSSVSSASTGLSTGAKAGIGVGVVLTVLIIAALSFLVLRQRKKLRQRQPDPQPSPQSQSHPYQYQDMKTELPNQPVSASTQMYQPELDGRQQRVEMDTSRRYPNTGMHEIG